MRLTVFALLALFVINTNSQQINGVDPEDLILGNLGQAQKHRAIIERVEQQLDDGQQVPARRLFFLCNAYYALRRYDQVAECGDRLAGLIESGDRGFYAGDLGAVPALLRARIARDLSQWQSAVYHAERALAILDAPEYAENMLRRYHSIQAFEIAGVTFALMHQAARAKHYLSRLEGVDLAISNIGPERQLAMARIHMALRDFTAALKAIEHPAAEIPADLKGLYDRTFQLLPQRFIAVKSRFELGHSDLARKGLDELLAHPRLAELSGLHWIVLLDRALLANQSNQPRYALSLLKRAVEIIETQRTSISSETGRIGFVGDKQAVYHALVRTLVTEGDNDAAFEYTERAKARALVELVAARWEERRPLRPTDGGVLRTLDALEGVWASLDEHDVERSPAERIHLRRGIRLLSEQLAAQDPRLAALVTVVPPSAEKLRKQLEPGELLLEYFYDDQQLILFAVDAEQIEAHFLDRKGIETPVKRLQQHLSYDPFGSETEQLLGDIGQRLLAPVGRLLGKRQLTIVPHGILHYLPFAALKLNGRTLVKDHAIRVLPNASVLNFVKAYRSRAEGALVIGNPYLGDSALPPLAAAETEAREIGELLQKAQVLTGRQATETLVKSQGHRFRFLHLASHGMFEPDHPFQSRVLLAADDENDGILSLDEVYEMRLDADLLTLSACETGIGQVAAGDDVVGLTRGFLQAGAASIVASLWKVDDRATRELMVEFYRQLKLTDKSEALRRAQLAARQRYPHPFFWAAFQLTGAI